MNNNDICKLNAINNSTGEVESIELLGGGAINRITEIEDKISNIETIINDIEKRNEITTVDLSSTIYNASYKSGFIGYYIRNGICIVSIKELLFSDQTTNSYVPHVITGFPECKSKWSSSRLINGTVNVGEIYIKEYTDYLVLRTIGTTPVWGSLVYFVD